MPVRLFRPESDPVESVLLCRDVLMLFLRYAKSEGVLCPKALYNRESLFHRFSEHCGKVPVDELKAFHLTEFVENHLFWAVSTKRVKAGEIKAAFKWAEDRERIKRSPFARIRYRQGERRPDLSDAVLAQIIATGGVLGSVLTFLRLTGCRVSEALEARWGHVDVGKGVWTIPKHKTRKKTGKAKVVALIPEACDLLRSIARAGAQSAALGVAPSLHVRAKAVPAVAEPLCGSAGLSRLSPLLATPQDRGNATAKAAGYAAGLSREPPASSAASITNMGGEVGAITPLAELKSGVVVFPVMPADAPIFVGAKGQPLRYGALLGRLGRVTKRLGVKARLHGIRHRFGSAAVAAGAPIKMVAQQMGHASVATTERFYVEVSGEIEAMRAAARMGQPIF